MLETKTTKLPEKFSSHPFTIYTDIHLLVEQNLGDFLLYLHEENIGFLKIFEFWFSVDLHIFRGHRTQKTCFHKMSVFDKFCGRSKNVALNACL